jgi:hypothetical protein
MWALSWAPHHTFSLVKTPLDLSGGLMGLVMGFMGLCWGFTPTRKSKCDVDLWRGFYGDT